MWVLDDKITSFNLQIFKVIYLVGHIIEVEKLYHTHVNKVTKIVYSDLQNP
jgi:hypothetical protein